MRINPADLGAGQRAREIMERQLRQMVRLVDDLLDVSRINTGKLTIKRDLVDLQQVIHDAFETVRPLVEQQGHVLASAPLARPVLVEGDATRLTQILSNLLNNAAKYTGRGGRIAVDVELEPQRVRIHVRDNGIGIAPEMRDAVFQMFVQADASLERTTAGLGVGLSLARRLAELHGGELSVHSMGLGYGSEFVLTLPLPKHAEAAPEPAAGPAAPGKAAVGGSRRILLADDNIDFVNSMGALLESHGHVVSVAYDGQSALDNAAAFLPDFAFLDIGLPSINGYDLARALRALPALRHTTLVAVTGWGQQKDRDLAKEAGFDAHLVKPVSFEQIQEMLNAKTPGVSADIRTN
jgi:CheY-like chemotaxis protein